MENSEKMEFMPSVDLALRRRPPIGRYDNGEWEEDGFVVTNGNIDDGGGDDDDGGDGLNETDDACGYFTLVGPNCPIVAMFLVRRRESAAPQSMKAKVAPFHNFILERGGALKLC